MVSYDVEWYHLLPSHVKEILECLQSSGRKAHVVGGAVRDLWLGEPPKDFDLVSEATPEEIEKLFPKTLDVGRSFGIMIVVTSEGPVEVARFRADGAYTDNRHPDEVIFADPEQDAKRRDFTINALFYDPASGKVMDYVGGVQDLESKRIRSVGNAATRFEEDALRMLRAVRFHSQLAHRKFSLDPDLLKAIQAQAHRLTNVSKERITQEMLRIFGSEKPSIGLKDLVTAGLWKTIFLTEAPDPEIFEPLDKLGPAFVKAFGQSPDSALSLAFLETRISGFQAENVFVLGKETKNKLRFTKELLPQVKELSRLDLAGQKSVMASPAFPEAWVIGALQTVLPEEFLSVRKKWSESGALNPTPLLNGRELMTLGVPEGPKVKEYLSKLRQMQLNEELSTKDGAIDFVKKDLA